ncbi:hypothetical protein SEA_MICRODON_12 [Streptomyces phage Microdon]|nr:hypothetical protein SEA_MICRODON_12 [Streptomyces phage Microdon]
MTIKLSFQTTQTPFGLVHDMQVEGGEKALTGKNGPVHYALSLLKPEGVAWVGPAYLAANGQAFRIGRLANKALVAWKSVKISSRFGKGGYRMRSVPGGYKGDYVTHWSRNINGKTFDFSRIYWNAGKDGSSLIVRRLGQDVHRWDSKTPVQMKTGFGK